MQSTQGARPIEARALVCLVPENRPLNRLRLVAVAEAGRVRTP